jgi:hypothetical protein
MNSVLVEGGKKENYRNTTERLHGESQMPPILKYVEHSVRFILNKKRAWTKNLPAPDLKIIHQNCEKAVADSTIRTANSTSGPRVTFHQVELRFYDQTLGDHPGTSYGPPISLDWHYQEAEPLHVNEFELYRGKRRTGKQQLILNFYSRRNTLMLCYGHTELEIEKAIKVCQKIALQRRVTNILLPLSKVEDFVASACGKTKRAVRFIKKRSS